jgi:hypothetical protein
MRAAVAQSVEIPKAWMKKADQPARKGTKRVRRELQRLQMLIAGVDPRSWRERNRRNDPDWIDHEKLSRLRALREQNLPPTNGGHVPVSLDDMHQGPEGTMRVAWEIFPPGTIDEVVRFFSKGVGGNKEVREGILRERVEAFMAIRPEGYIRGIDRFDGYIGAKISDKLVVFENWRYGNALYVVSDNWERIAKRPRLDLLRDDEAKPHFERIIHGPGWQKRLEDTIRRARSLGGSSATSI